MNVRELYIFGFKIDSKCNPAIDGNNVMEEVEGKENFAQRLKWTVKTDQIQTIIDFKQCE